MVKHKARWQKQIQETVNQNQKDFQITDAQAAIQTGIAIVLVHGPPGSPYEGYSFRLQYNGQQIPYVPPKIRFLDIPWSPYICPKTGNICCDILQAGKKKLKDCWSPALTLTKVVLSIVSILNQDRIPNNQPGLNMQAAAQLRLKYSTFFQNARENAIKNHYSNQFRYKDQQKLPVNHPEDLQKQDIQFMKEKDKFMNDPKMKQAYKNKLNNVKAKKSQDYQ